MHNRPKHMSKTMTEIKSEYWKPLEQAELQHKSAIASQKEELLIALIEAFEPYSHVKRINKRQTDAIDEKLKDNSFGFRQVKVEPREWFPGFKLMFWYSRKQWDFRTKDYANEYTYENNNIEDASGSTIIAMLKERLKQQREWNETKEYEPVEAYEKFYQELEELADKHKCGKNAIHLLRYYR
jgi:hypothetical protein